MSTPTAVAALRCLYGAASAELRGDEQDVAALVDSALSEAGFGCTLEVAVLSLAEQLRDIGEDRGLRPRRLLHVLRSAHAELSRSCASGTGKLTDLILSGAESYLTGAADLWPEDELCALAARPADTLTVAVRVLAAALRWRAWDTGCDALAVTADLCLKLAGRDAQLCA